MSQQINLFNPIFLKQKKYFSAVTMAQALGLILLGSAALTGYLTYQSHLLKAEGAAASAQLAAVQAQLTQLNEASSRQKNRVLEEGVRKMEAEVSTLQHVFDTLQKGEVGSTDGYSDYFRAFSRQIVSGVWLTGLTIYGAGNEIGVRGRTLQPELVPEYLGRLKREATMKGKSFSTLEMHAPSIEQTVGSGQTATRRQVPANYIEFNLRSADLPREKTDLPGAQTK